MNAFVVNKGSWHYRWLCFYRACLDKNFRRGSHDAVWWFEQFSIRPQDFCQYWRMAVLWPVVRIGLNIAAYAAALVLLLNISVDGAISVGVALLGVAAFIVVCLIIAGIVEAIKRVGKKVSRKTVAGSSGSIVQTAYAAWKDKFCPTLEYEKGEE